MSDLLCFLLAFAAFAIAALYLESLGLLRPDPSLFARPARRRPSPSRAPRRPRRRLDGAIGFGEAVFASPTPRPHA